MMSGEDVQFCLLWWEICSTVVNKCKAEFGLGVWHFLFLLIFFFLHAFVGLWLLFMFIYGSMNSNYKVWPFSFYFLVNQCTLCTVYGSIISHFNNFFIKNGSHGTIYTFKNYFITVFFSFSVSVFSFQFSAVSKRTLSVCLTNLVFVNLFYYSTYFHYYL